MILLRRDYFLSILKNRKISGKWEKKQKKNSTNREYTSIWQGIAKKRGEDY